MRLVFIFMCISLISVQAKTYDEYTKCSIWGTSRVFNYAGKGYDLKDDCNIVLSTTNCTYTAYSNQLIPFSIELERDSNSYNVLALSLSIKMYGIHYKILRERIVLVNDQLAYVPYQGYNDVSITYYGNKLVFSSLAFEVDWDGYESIDIYMYKNYENYLCGVCSGDYSPDSVAYGAYSSMTSKCDYSSKYSSNQCDKTKYKGVEYCGLMKKKDSPWKNYITKLNKEFVDYLYESCVSDMCNYEHDSSIQTYMRCQYYQTLSQACYTNGDYDYDWRTVTGCVLKCGDNKVYGVHKEKPKTCMYPSSTYTEALVHREGCYCKKGQVYDSNENCVYLNDCGCKMHDGSQMIEVGHSYYSNDCSSVYECRTSNANVYASNHSCASGYVCGLDANRQRACVEQKKRSVSTYVEPPVAVPLVVEQTKEPIVEQKYEPAAVIPYVAPVDDKTIADLIKSSINSYFNYFVKKYFYEPSKEKSSENECDIFSDEDCFKPLKKYETTTIATRPYRPPPPPPPQPRPIYRPQPQYIQQPQQYETTTTTSTSTSNQLQEILDLLTATQTTTVTATLSNLDLLPTLTTPFPSDFLNNLMGLTTPAPFNTNFNDLLSQLQPTTPLNIFQNLVNPTPSFTNSLLNSMPFLAQLNNAGHQESYAQNPYYYQQAPQYGNQIHSNMYDGYGGYQMQANNMRNILGSLQQQQPSVPFGPMTATLSNLDIFQALTPTTPNVMNNLASLLNMLPTTTLTVTLSNLDLTPTLPSNLLNMLSNLVTATTTTTTSTTTKTTTTMAPAIAPQVYYENKYYPQNKPYAYY